MTSVDRRHRLAVAGKTNEKMSFDWPLSVCVATTQQAATTLTRRVAPATNTAMIRSCANSALDTMAVET
jgi:hypothetical protein